MNYYYNRINSIKIIRNKIYFDLKADGVKNFKLINKNGEKLINQTHKSELDDCLFLFIYLFPKNSKNNSLNKIGMINPYIKKLCVSVPSLIFICGLVI